MSVIESAAPRPASAFLRGRTARRLLVMAAALATIGTLAALLGALGLHVAEPAVAPKNPFGTGLREAAPSGAGLGAFVLALQSQFYRLLTGAVSTLRREGTGLWTLVAIGFAYGVFHAAGPGHGKGVISAYIVASRRTLGRGLALSLAAALLQALVAVMIVAVLVGVAGATSRSVNATAGVIEVASFALVAAVGLLLLWRRTARVVPAGPGSGHAADCACCEGAHMPSAAAVERASTWREAAGIVLAAGLRPCSGAIILLVFAASQGLVLAGLAATLAMALGTAITTGAFAALAVLAKSVALRVASRESLLAALAPWLEVAAAAFVAILGLLLLVGASAGAGGS